MSLAIHMFCRMCQAFDYDKPRNVEEIKNDDGRTMVRGGRGAAEKKHRSRRRSRGRSQTLTLIDQDKNRCL